MATCNNLKTILAVLTASLALSINSFAATYSVDASNPTAADKNGGSKAAPWKTIQHAVDAVKSGDTIVVGPGQYEEFVTVKASGAENNLITVRAEPAREARVKNFVLQADYISVEGFEITNDSTKTGESTGISAGQAELGKAQKGCQMIENYIHDVDGRGIITGEKAVVRNNVLRNVGWGMFVYSGSLVEGNEIDGLTVKMVEKEGKTVPRLAKYMFFNGEDITFRGNYLHGTPMKNLAGMGVCFFGSWDAGQWSSSRRILIENNRCFNATHASEPIGKVRKQSSHITYRNNLFVNTVYVGVMPQGFSHVTVENNTFINCGAYPVWFAGGETDTVVRNNLIAYYDHKPLEGHGAAESGIRIDSNGPTNQTDYNLFSGTKNRGYGKNEIMAEPKFMDPAHGDFRLKAGSPGIDAGMKIDAIKTDLRGAPRPQGKGYDVGCYEWGADADK